MSAMNQEQLALARHALGLPNDNGKSYRNRFYAAVNTRDWQQWNNMVERGLADKEKCDGSTVKHCWFWLTREGATLALMPRESLDAEDFPRAEAKRAAERETEGA